MAKFKKGDRFFVKEECHTLFGKVGTILDNCIYPIVRLDDQNADYHSAHYINGIGRCCVINEDRLSHIFETRTPNIKCGSFYQFKEGQTIITVERPKGQDLSGSATVKIDRSYRINPTLKQIFISFIKELSLWLQRKIK